MTPKFASVRPTSNDSLNDVKPLLPISLCEKKENDGAFAELIKENTMLILNSEKMCSLPTIGEKTPSA